jgi:hypothetical protein
VNGRGGWVRMTTPSMGDEAPVKAVWRCVGESAASTWDWWGNTGTEAWAVGGAAGQECLGWFNAIRAVHRPWSREESSSFTLGRECEEKKSSTPAAATGRFKFKCFKLARQKPKAAVLVLGDLGHTQAYQSL